MKEDQTRSSSITSLDIACVIGLYFAIPYTSLCIVYTDARCIGV